VEFAAAAHNHDASYSALGHNHSGVYEPVNTLLSAIAGLSMIADRYIYGTGSGTVSLGTITSFARGILDDADAAAVISTIGAATSGHNHSGVYQPVDATLTAFAALTIAANTYIRGTGADAFAVDSAAASTILARRASGNLGAQTYANIKADLGAIAQTVTAATGTTFTPALTDVGTHVIVNLSNAGTKTVTIDTTSITYTSGMVINFINTGAGAATFQGGGGLTLNRKATQTLVLSQYGAASVIFQSDTVATLVGGMTAA
jgi:hypothetical protein